MENLHIDEMKTELKTMKVILRKKIVRNKIKDIDKDVLEELFINEIPDEVDSDLIDDIGDFYYYAIENLDLSSINWDNVIPDDNNYRNIAMLKLMIGFALESGNYSTKNRLHLPKELLEKTLFARFYVEGQKTMKVPIFHEMKIQNLDLSEVDFSDVCYDVKSFYTAFLMMTNIMPGGCRIENYKLFAVDAMNSTMNNPHEKIDMDLVKVQAESILKKIEASKSPSDSEAELLKELIESINTVQTNSDKSDAMDKELKDAIGNCEGILGVKIVQPDEKFSYYVDLSNTNAKVIFNPINFGSIFISEYNFANLDLSDSIGDGLNMVLITNCDVTNTNLMDTIKNNNVLCMSEKIIDNTDPAKKFKKDKNN